MKTINIAYFVLLTCLLTVKEPLAFLGGTPAEGGLGGLLSEIAHFLAFALLALLARLARWPVAPIHLCGLLCAYALGTETVQAFLPWRTAEVRDLLQNLAGISVGWLLAPAVSWAQRQVGSRNQSR